MTDFFYFYNSLLCNSSKEPALSALQETAASFVSKKIEEISAKEAYTDKKPAIGQPLDTASLSPLSRFLLTRWARIIYLIFFLFSFLRTTDSMSCKKHLLLVFANCSQIIFCIGKCHSSFINEDK